eukprot:6651617-Pyramimonas_sp.AAC.1
MAGRDLSLPFLPCRLVEQRVSGGFDGVDNSDIPVWRVPEPLRQIHLWRSLCYAPRTCDVRGA